MSYALAASYLFILLITLTLSKALDITILLTYLKSASSFFSCYAVLCVSITKPAEISCFDSSRSSLTKLLYLLGLVNKDLELSKQKISAGC
ncbi:hypothetical protein HBH90_224730 [Parastagonospora nodorum]|nr:hypothetical protein HBI02_224930 [Parastagonospora nodorum]KAH4356108.1 hypothetical protein HBH94_232420 [Parastagonospora nodorum]KAH4443128.1 hypothetical protein HBH90_224730 [Parastagonospora nodorum]KAH4571768.1 hypothetical protein HBH83_219630 [Parastagonospora nodorum]KAH4812144.1 hypothetical protein HBH60_237950 [Parastagonospora nodorum]